MRLFITVNMDKRVQDQLASEITELKNLYPGGRWVTKDNLHLTMLFLGEVPNEIITIVKQQIKESVKGILPFTLQVAGIGTFSSVDKSIILWAGVKGDTEKLNILYRQLINEISKIDLKIDSRSHFNPHITLARKIKYNRLAENIDFITSSWEVNSLELYQSIFTNNGVKYQRIFSEKFTKNE